METTQYQALLAGAVAVIAREGYTLPMCGSDMLRVASEAVEFAPRMCGPIADVLGAERLIFETLASMQTHQRSELKARIRAQNGEGK